MSPALNKTRDPLSIDGWMTPNELAWLEEQASSMDSIVEVGCWKGRSTSALLRGCRGTVYAVDHWRGSPGDPDALESEAACAYEKFMENVGSAKNLQVIRQGSLEAAQEIPMVDMVFIDASHRYADVVSDILAWRPKALKLLCGHDIFWMVFFRP